MTRNKFMHIPCICNVDKGFPSKFSDKISKAFFLPKTSIKTTSRYNSLATKKIILQKKVFYFFLLNVSHS